MDMAASFARATNTPMADANAKPMPVVQQTVDPALVKNKAKEEPAEVPLVNENDPFAEKPAPPKAPEEPLTPAEENKQIADSFKSEGQRAAEALLKEQKAEEERKYEESLKSKEEIAYEKRLEDMEASRKKVVAEEKVAAMEAAYCAQLKAEREAKE